MPKKQEKYVCENACWIVSPSRLVSNYIGWQKKPSSDNGAVFATVCSSKTIQNVRFFRILSPLVSRDFGVREPKSVQKVSKFAVVTRAWYHLRLKCNFAPFFALERCNWVDFSSVFGRNSEKFRFFGQISIGLKWRLNASNWLKNTFFEL